MATPVRIRQWTDKDEQGTWEILKEAGFSNLNSTFQIALSRRLSLCSASTAALIAGLMLKSFIAVVCALVLYACFVYLLCLLGMLYYIYGPTYFDMKNARLNYFRDDDHCFWIAEVNGGIVGTIGIVKKSSDPSGEKTAWLRRMAVKTGLRRLGIAKKLVTTAISFCQEHDYHKIELITTEVHKPAQSLYTRLGFSMKAYKPYKYVCGLITVWTYEFVYKINHNKTGEQL